MKTRKTWKLWVSHMKKSQKKKKKPASCKFLFTKVGMETTAMAAAIVYAVFVFFHVIV